jgi:hypothetical protein
MGFGIPRAMNWAAAARAALILCCIAAPAQAEPPPLRDPAFLNIGLSCRWEMQCINSQKKAMKQALGYVRKGRPATWRIHMCNRNAGRGYQRVDWVGFDHCIRNASLTQPAPPPPSAKRSIRARPHHHRR